MAVVKTLGIAIVENNDNPNFIPTLQANHLFTKAKTVDGKKEWKFLPDNPIGKKWKLIDYDWNVDAIEINADDFIDSEFFIDELDTGMYRFKKLFTSYNRLNAIKYLIANNSCGDESGENGDCSESNDNGIITSIGAKYPLAKVAQHTSDVYNNQLFTGKAQLLVEEEDAQDFVRDIVKRKKFTLYVPITDDSYIREPMIYVKEDFYDADGNIVLATDFVLQNDIMLEGVEKCIGFYNGKDKNIYRHIIYVKPNLSNNKYYLGADFLTNSKIEKILKMQRIWDYNSWDFDIELNEVDFDRGFLNITNSGSGYYLLVEYVKDINSDFDFYGE